MFVCFFIYLSKKKPFCPCHMGHKDHDAKINLVPFILARTLCYNIDVTGKKTLDLIILGIATLMTGAVLGVFVYTEILFEKEAPSEAAEKEDLMLFAKNNAGNDNFKIDKIVINLAAEGSRLRFLEIEMHLVPFKSRYNDVFERTKAYINDAVIDVASNMQPAELNSVAGKIILQDRIRKRLNSYYQKDIVKEIFFSSFVVQ